MAQSEAFPRLPVHLPDFQFGGGLKEGEVYRLTESEVRFGLMGNYLAVRVDGTKGLLRGEKVPIRAGHVQEDASFLSDADFLALYLNIFWQIDTNKISWESVEALLLELQAELQRRGVSAMRR